MLRVMMPYLNDHNTLVDVDFIIEWYLVITKWAKEWIHQAIRSPDSGQWWTKAGRVEGAESVNTIQGNPMA
jgi:hypothetical protein